MAKNNDSMQTLQATLQRREFWVGLATTVIVLLVAFKLIPWNRMPKLTTNKTMNVLTATNRTASSGATMNQEQMTATSEASATSSASMTNTAPAKKVNTLADTTGGYYTVQNGDNFYKISVKVCGTGKYFESIQAENNYAALYAGDQIVVTCAE